MTTMPPVSLETAEAIEAVRAGGVFTTHTPVPAGHDHFPEEMIQRYFSDWCHALGLSCEDLMRLARRGQAAALRQRLWSAHSHEPALAATLTLVACGSNVKLDETPVEDRTGTPAGNRANAAVSVSTSSISAR